MDIKNTSRNCNEIVSGLKYIKELKSYIIQENELNYLADCLNMAFMYIDKHEKTYNLFEEYKKKTKSELIIENIDLKNKINEIHTFVERFTK